MFPSGPAVPYDQRVLSSPAPGCKVQRDLGAQGLCPPPMPSRANRAEQCGPAERGCDVEFLICFRQPLGLQRGWWWGNKVTPQQAKAAWSGRVGRTGESWWTTKLPSEPRTDCSFSTGRHKPQTAAESVMGAAEPEDPMEEPSLQHRS